MTYVPRKTKTTILRPDEEKEILNFIIEKAKKGEEVLRKDVTDQVMTYLMSDMRKNPFRAGVPGDKWFSLFRRRHNDRFKEELDPEMLRNAENAVSSVNKDVSLKRRVIIHSPNELNI